MAGGDACAAARGIPELPGCGAETDRAAGYRQIGLLPGGSVTIDDGRKGPKFAGLIVGTGQGSPGVEADVGVNYSAMIK